MRLIQMVVMVAGSCSSCKGELTAGGFVGFLLLVGVFFRPIEKINSVIETYPKGIAGFRRYIAFLDTEPDIADRPGVAGRPRLARRHRAIDDVRFGYTSDRDGPQRRRPDDPGRRDRGLRRPLGRGQDDDLLAAAALLRGRQADASPSTASTSAT